jgi:hypothetical protein
MRSSAFLLAAAGLVLQPAAAFAQSGDVVAPQAGGGMPPKPEVAGIAPDEPRRLGGIWRIEKFIFAIPNAPLLPEAKAAFDRQVRAASDGEILYTAWTSCRPGAPSSMVMPMNSLIVIEGPTDITISFEEPRMTRRVRMNAEHPADLKPSYMGDSVGHWEGDTLVIDTIGYNGQFQLDTHGLPSSEQLHTVERLTKSADGKRVTVQTTFEDPGYYSAPFTTERAWVPNPARHQFEYDCMENPRAEEFVHTYFVKDLYRPSCVRFEGDETEPSKILCRKPEEQTETLRKIAERAGSQQ